jgi:hypothetical protein
LSAEATSGCTSSEEREPVPLLPKEVRRRAESARREEEARLARIAEAREAPTDEYEPAE